MHLVFVTHYIYGRDLAIPNVYPVHQLHEGLICISHHHAFFPLDPLIANGLEDDFLGVTVCFLDLVIFVQVVMLLLVCDGNVDMHGVDRVRR